MQFIPKQVCSSAIDFEIVEGKLRKVVFTDGCPGNLKALASLVEGMNVEEVIQRLKGIHCGDKGTSCGDQLAQALQDHI